MTAPTAKMSVWVSDKFACIKIVGRANFISSVDFKTLVHELDQKGCRCLVLDLSECLLMDSTFLGVLAGIGLKVSSSQGGSDQRGVELLNPSARITELLETLGVLHLFKIVQGTLGPSAESPAREHVAGSPTRTEVNRTCLEAHQTLMDINPANVPRFKDVTKFLAEDLKKSKPE